ncbi:uncharacterized protein PG986_010867 [Apiospora aurea]|uniref:Uncharacterized protein n=1 Tax=Apiospora aurea TaxID=335848 RepID=A0ABR1Q3H0_9PEZI
MMLTSFILAAGLAPAILAKPIRKPTLGLESLTTAVPIPTTGDILPTITKRRSRTLTVPLPLETDDLGLEPDFLPKDKRGLVIPPVSLPLSLPTQVGSLLPSLSLTKDLPIKTDTLLPSLTLINDLPVKTDTLLPSLTLPVTGLPLETDDLDLPAVIPSVTVPFPLETPAVDPDLDFAKKEKRQGAGIGGGLLSLTKALPSISIPVPVYAVRPFCEDPDVGGAEPQHPSADPHCFCKNSNVIGVHHQHP